MRMAPIMVAAVKAVRVSINPHPRLATAFVVAFGTSVATTWGVRRIAIRLGYVNDEQFALSKVRSGWPAPG